MSARFAAAAAALEGAPFRLHGRDRATGIDCVGLVALALAGCGRPAIVPEGYALRATSVAPLLRFFALNHFAEVARNAPDESGDLLLLRPDPIQAHLAVIGGDRSLIHAHAGLGRVVIEPGPPRWPVAGRWRLQDED